jgi:hypothetical protein
MLRVVALLFGSCFTVTGFTVAGQRTLRAVSAPQMLFSNKAASKPPSLEKTSATTVVRRDLFAYTGLGALVLGVPAVDWNALGGIDYVNGARLAYFSVVAIGSVYLGVQRQDLGESAPITGQSAALAPLFASVTLGGLYFLIKYTGLNPGPSHRSPPTTLHIPHPSPTTHTPALQHSVLTVSLCS